MVYKSMTGKNINVHFCASNLYQPIKSYITIILPSNKQQTTPKKVFLLKCMVNMVTKNNCSKVLIVLFEMYVNRQLGITVGDFKTTNSTYQYIFTRLYDSLE